MMNSTWCIVHNWNNYIAHEWGNVNNSESHWTAYDGVHRTDPLCCCQLLDGLARWLSNTIEMGLFGNIHIGTCSNQTHIVVFAQCMWPLTMFLWSFVVAASNAKLLLTNVLLFFKCVYKGVIHLCAIMLEWGKLLGVRNILKHNKVVVAANSVTEEQQKSSFFFFSVCTSVFSRLDFDCQVILSSF